MLGTFEIAVASPLVIKSRYEIKTVLGRGGMGVVYQAFDSLMKRDVAVKTLREVPDGVMVELFYRECTVLAGMVHPNVIEIFDMGEFDDGDNVSKPFYVMPLLPGRTFHDLIYPAGNPLPVNRCVDIVSQACRGLQAAHDRELLHRDIKPRNIFVMKDDAVKLIDFGVAHLMGSNSTGMRGTPQYMSPEQITFKPLQRQSDIFSMATVCYEALTAVHPFLRNPGGRDSVSDIAGAITGYTPPLVSDLNPAVNRAVAQVVAKGMAKDSWNRFESAAAFADALQKALRNEGTVKPNTAGVQIRLERARRSLDQKDFQFASEIIGELESEGNSDPEIRRIRGDLEAAVTREKTGRLIEAATRYFASEEFTLALRKVQEILQIEPANPPALELKKKIEDVLTEQRVLDLLKTASECIDRAAFTGARQAIQDALKLRPNDPRVRQLLNEVDARQKEILRQRQDQERLFQAAHAAWLAGKIKSALANLEELTKLTRLLSEPGERINEYQDFYRRIRAEQDAVESALEQARNLLSNADFAGVQRICDRYLRKYPEHEDFMALAGELGKRREEEAAAFRASIANRLAAEPNLNLQAEILEEALNTRPRDEFLEREMARVTERQKQVKAVVAKARGLENQQAFESAAKEWENLSALYPQYPNLQDHIAKARAAWQNQRAQTRNVWIKRISAALENSQHAAALRLLDDAAREFPADNELNELAARAQAQAQRFAAVHSLIAKGGEAAGLQQFEPAERALSEAGELSRGIPDLVARVSAVLVQAASLALGGQNADWRTAKGFLDQASQLDPALPFPAALWQQIGQREREESVRNVLQTAVAEQEAGRLKEARERVENALKTYPTEQRLLSRLQSIDAVAAENRRREERQAALRDLNALHGEIQKKESPAELGECVQRARDTAESYPGDPEIAQLAKDIAEQGEAFDRAAAALARDETRSCAAACEEMLAQLPGYRLFLNLKLEAEIRETQKAAEFLDSVERQLAAEPDLGKRAQILEAAVRKNPDEPYYQEGLRLVRGKQDLVNAVVQRAQLLESNGWFAEALDRWQYLKTIHPTLAGLEESIARCSRLLEEKRERGRQQYLSSIRSALEKRDYASALQDFTRALVEFPEDAELQELGRLAREGRDRKLRCEKLLKDGLEHLEAGQFSEGRQTLRKAIEAAAGDPVVARSAAIYLLEYGREALAADLELAESMIAEACSIDPDMQAPPDLQTALNEARRGKEFEKCAEAAAACEERGDIDGALNIIAGFLTRYPGDKPAQSLRERLLDAQEESIRRAQRARDLEELKKLEDQSQTLVQRSNLLDLLRQTEQIAGRNAQNQEVTVAAGALSGILSALAEIRHLLSENQFSEAERLCSLSIERFPSYRKFADLRTEIEARRNERAEEYLQQTKRELANEPDFRKQAALLEEACRAFPDEPYYLGELDLVRNRLALLEEEIARAQELEKNELYEDALQEWKTLRSLYPWFPGLDAGIARVTQLSQKKKDEIANAWLVRIQDAMNAAQYDAASRIVQDALRDLPAEPRLLAFREELENILRKQAAARDALQKGKTLLDASDLNGALASFDTALRLTPQDAGLRNSIAGVLLEKARVLVADKWKEAEKLAVKIVEVQPGYAIPSELRDEIRRRKRVDELARMLQEIDRDTANGNWAAARQSLDLADMLFPAEPAIRKRSQTVAAAMQAIEAERVRAASLQSLAASRSQLNATAKRRPLTRLRTSLLASPLLTSGDPEVRSGAQALLSDVDARLQALDAARTENKWLAIVRNPAFLLAASLALGIALCAVFWLRHVASLQSVALKVSPEHVSVAVNGQTCTVPDCDLKLRPGQYQVHFTKTGYIPQTVSLTVGRENNKALPLTATLLPLPLALQIAGNMNGAGIYLDGVNVGAARAGQFSLATVPKGAHVLAVSGEEGKASLPLLSNENGGLVVQGSLSSTDLSILAVMQEDGAESLIASVLSPQPVYVDNERVGVTSGGVLRLPKLGDGAHQIQAGAAAGSLRFSLPARPRPSLYAFISGKSNTGTLSVSTNVSDADLIVDGKRYPGTPASKGKFQLLLPAKTYQIHSERPGYAPSDPLSITVDRSAETTVKLHLTPHPIILEVRGAASGTAVKVDGVPVGVVAGRKPLQHEIGPGNHLFELAREGFKPKRFQRRFEPGGMALIAGADVELTPAASNPVNTSGNNPAIDAAAAQKAQQTEWEAVDKQSLPALQAYVRNHPQSPYTAQANQTLGGLQEAEKLRTEQSDWSAADKNSRKSLEDFLARYPGGAHATAAGRLVSELKKKEEAAQLDQAEGNAWSAVNVKDRPALEGFVKLFPSGRHRPDAERALSNLTSPVVAPDESPAVLAAIQRLADAWNSKNSQAIFEAQPSLNKRTVKTLLETAQSIHLTISPLHAPEIAGSRATVVCHRKMEQVFSDGTQKSPESTVTFVLKKNGNRWVIESAM